MAGIKIFNCNVRGLNNHIKRREIFHYLQCKSYDIFVLQETHSSKRLQKRWQCEWGGRVFFTHSQTNAKGVCIMFKRSASVKVLDSVHDKDGRIIGLTIEYNNVHVFLLNIYAPNEDDSSFFIKVAELLEKTDCVHKIVLGDFNLYLDKDLDRVGTDTPAKKAADIVKTIMDEYELIDVWREFN